MADLTITEERKLEQLFEVGSEYVLNFGDRTFAEFFADAVGIDIDLAKYHEGGSSKAKRLRTFWQAESNHAVGRLVAALTDLAAKVQGNRIDPAAGLQAGCRVNK